ncbi:MULTISPECIES: type II secretion system protein N [unclassified Sphingomonas]|uniref:type II secretion system protein N n=1 Tax=unclassified Sphingomonas TaxID=196159 RepID=UPI001F57155F|nr:MULTISPECIES: type II secretion system protein N [unclassified Sphingomonas]
MTPIRLKTRPTALLGAVFVVTLVLLLPMRLALGMLGAGEQGLSARTVSGSLWSGTLRDAHFAGLPLGDLDARVSPLALLVGRARVALDSRGAARPVHGAASVSRHGFGVESMSASLPTGTLFAPLPVAGLDLDALTVRFRDGQCIAAEGRVRAALSGSVGGIVLPASVAGDARCDGGALLLPLASQAGTESVALRITGAGTYRAALSMRPADATAAQRLEAAGFTPAGGAYRLSIEGRF